MPFKLEMISSMNKFLILKLDLKLDLKSVCCHMMIATITMPTNENLALTIELSNTLFYHRITVHN